MDDTQAQVSAPAALTDAERRELEDLRAILKSDRERAERERQIRLRDELKFKDEWEAVGRPVRLEDFIRWKNGGHDTTHRNPDDWVRDDERDRKLHAARNAEARAAIDRDRRRTAWRYEELFTKELAEHQATRPARESKASNDRGYSR